MATKAPKKQAKKRAPKKRPTKTTPAKAALDIKKALTEGLDREDYIMWLTGVIIGETKFEVRTAIGTTETMAADAKTRIVYGKELTKLRGWYDQEVIAEETGKVVIMLPDNGRVAS